MKPHFHPFICAALLLCAPAAPAADKLSLVVMDPLSKELACDCVAGYAQRNYRVLAAHLQRKLNMEVSVVHAEDLATGIKDSKEPPGLIIGKSSVILSAARKHKLEVVPIARLTGKDGSPDQHGLLVVRKDSPAQTVADLAGYRILFGPEDCDEKCAAAVALLQKSGVAIPGSLEASPSCSTAATALMELKPEVRAVAVISSYAEPLLAGCGTIKKGDLRVIGKTENVPFITAFAAKSLSPKKVAAITEALLDTGGDPELLKVMESLIGFVEMTEPADPKPAAWNQFRGPGRDGAATWLPDKLPSQVLFAWEVTLPSDGVGGLAAANDVIIVGGRDALDAADAFFVLMPAPAPSAGDFSTRRPLVSPSIMATHLGPHL